MVQWLRLCVSIAGGTVSIPSCELRSYMHAPACPPPPPKKIRTTKIMSTEILQYFLYITEYLVSVDISHCLMNVLPALLKFDSFHQYPNRNWPFDGWYVSKVPLICTLSLHLNFAQSFVVVLIEATVLSVLGFPCSGFEQVPLPLGFP